MVDREEAMLQLLRGGGRTKPLTKAEAGRTQRQDAARVKCCKARIGLFFGIYVGCPYTIVRETSIEGQDGACGHLRG